MYEFISILLYLLKLVLWPSKLSILDKVLCATEKLYIILLFCDILYSYQLGIFVQICGPTDSVLLILSLVDQSTFNSETLKCYSMIVLMFIGSFMCSTMFYEIGCTGIWCVYTYNC